MPTVTLPFSGLRLGWRRLEAVETGAVIPIDRALLSGVRSWLAYGSREFLRTANVEDIIEIDAVPGMPRPYYLLWGVMRRAGLRPGTQPRLSVMFADKTFAHEHPEPRADGLVINGACRDISKSRVQAVFADVFGYPLALDPTTHHGPMVEKSEVNAAHDGQVVRGPRARREGFVYERVIDNSDAGWVTDLRCPTVFGQLAVVCLKRRPLARRFDNYTPKCALAEPMDVFTPDERAKIARFCAAMQLDWGGLDILRDRASGKIYIVDVNKTDMPVIALTTAEKLEVTDRLARLLRTEIESRL